MSCFGKFLRYVYEKQYVIYERFRRTINRLLLLKNNPKARYACFRVLQETCAGLSKTSYHFNSEITEKKKYM